MSHIWSGQCRSSRHGRVLDWTQCRNRITITTGGGGGGDGDGGDRAVQDHTWRERHREGSGWVASASNYRARYR